MLKRLSILIIPILFLVIGIATLPDYGMNWDNPMHFMRGQAYLQYFLTGDKDFSKLPEFRNSPCVSGNLGLLSTVLLDNMKGDKECGSLTDVKRSYYQYEYYNFNYFIQNDSGHPVINDILASLSNYIFYQKLGLFGDTISYNIFMIVASFVLILFVAFFVEKEFGLLPAIVSSLVLASYPLFFSESHFNVKDPPEAVFFGLTLIFFYWGTVENSWKKIIISAIFAGLALGTKLNIIFAPLIVFPWFIYFIIINISPKSNFKNLLNFINVRKMMFLSLLLYLPICFGLVYLSWPFLWHDTFVNISKILGYYIQIGVGTQPDMSGYLFKGWNLYPIFWIIITTSIPVLIFSFLGLLFPILYRNSKKSIPYLFVLLWFIVPVLRTSWPNADIYGGVRQIMEYIPALAILCGIGIYALILLRKKYLKGKIFSVIFYPLLIVAFSFSIFEIIMIHPNENVYFNKLIRGLSGAKAKNVPSWGNTYGNIYLQGVKWLNSNAEKGAKVALPVAVMSNIPRTMLRTDLDYNKPNWSGTNRMGEYGIEMDYNWWPKAWYSYQYYDQYLEPVYVISVNGVPLLKIWKNDLQHTKPQFKEESVYTPKNIMVEVNILGSDIKIDMGKELYVTRFTVKHDSYGCKNGLLGYVALSRDRKTWEREPDPITAPQVAPGVDGKIIGWSDVNFVYLFAGKKARYIMLDPQTGNSCLLKNIEIKVYGLKILP